MTLRLDVPTDFGFTEEHALLRAEARRFLAERLPIAELRRLVERLPQAAVSAKECFRGEDQRLPDYLALVESHNPRRRPRAR